ncbi:uncharacterized protein LOC141909095 isoform X2 [Tubulanus polymorphus]|uniref:uncharacterized protein LOC141909095 isoform X2 n=1 Tax=Tubulanus polymorphus TaxID=672921 RepID=UPI003DA46158
MADINEESAVIDGDGELGQQKKIEIIRKLLKNFDLEKTKHKYSNLEPIDMKIDPSSYSVDCSFEATAIRERLIHLMGSDIVRMNDQKYMEQLQERVRDEYYEMEEKKEKQLMEDERRRIRRLINEGVIQSSDSEEAQRLGYGHETKVVERRNKKDSQQPQHHCHHDSIMHRGDQQEDDEDSDKEKAGDEESGEKEDETNGDGKQHPDPLINKFRHESTIPALYQTGHDVVMSTLEKDENSHGPAQTTADQTQTQAEEQQQQTVEEEPPESAT